MRLFPALRDTRSLEREETPATASAS
jgi:hypothetical protein